MPRIRTTNFNMRLKAEELKKLRALAEEQGETASSLIRRFIRRSKIANRRSRAGKTKEG